MHTLSFEIGMHKDKDGTFQYDNAYVIRVVYTMVRTHNGTQNESNPLFLVTFFAIMTLSEQIKVSQSSPSMWLSVFEKI